MKKTICLAIGAGILVTVLHSTGVAGAQSNAAPLIISHRGGNANWPENTLCAFRHNVSAGVAAIELDVQLTQDGEVVVYHPTDLNVWTSSSGKVTNKTSKNVVGLSAVENYTGPDTYKTQCTPAELRIPKLVDVLASVPNRIPIIIDMKSLPAKNLVEALVQKIPDDQWSRLRFYSTSSEHTAMLRTLKPNAIIFEDRGVTFSRLLKLLASQDCVFEAPQAWVGYELKRSLEVCDKTRLGRTCVESLPFVMWSPDAMRCIRQMTGAQVVLFGVNTPDDYAFAHKLGANAVFSDDPEALLSIKRTKK